MRIPSCAKIVQKGYNYEDIFDGENDKSDFDMRQLRANLLCQSLCDEHET